MTIRTAGEYLAAAVQAAELERELAKLPPAAHRRREELRREIESVDAARERYRENGD